MVSKRVILVIWRVGMGAIACGVIMALAALGVDPGAASVMRASALGIGAGIGVPVMLVAYVLVVDRLIRLRVITNRLVLPLLVVVPIATSGLFPFVVLAFIGMISSDPEPSPGPRRAEPAEIVTAVQRLSRHR